MYNKELLLQKYIYFIIKQDKLIKSHNFQLLQIKSCTSRNKNMFQKLIAARGLRVY